MPPLLTSLVGARQAARELLVRRGVQRLGGSGDLTARRDLRARSSRYHLGGQKQWNR